MAIIMSRAVDSAVLCISTSSEPAGIIVSPSSMRVIVMVAGCGVLAATAIAQQAAHPTPLKQIAPNVYVSPGGIPACTSTVIIGNTSVIVVDAKTTPDDAK